MAVTRRPSTWQSPPPCPARHPDGFGQCVFSHGHKSRQHLVISYCNGPEWQGTSETHDYEHSHSHRWGGSVEATTSGGLIR